MTKKNRMRKAWERNWDLWMVKGVYFNMGQPWRNCLTPRQVIKFLKREKI